MKIVYNTSTFAPFSTCSTVIYLCRSNSLRKWSSLKNTRDDHGQVLLDLLNTDDVDKVK